MYIISPGQFELYYTRSERRIHRLLAQLPKLTVIAAAALIFLLVYWIEAEFTDSETEYLMFGGFISVRLMREGMLLAIPLSLISLLARGKWERPFQFLALTAVWLANTHWYFRKLELWPAQVLCLAFVPVLCTAGFIFLRTGTAKRRLAAAAFTLFYLALAALVSLLLWQHAHELTVFWRLRTHLIYLGFMMMSLKPERGPNEAAFAFLPFHALRGTFWPDEIHLEEDRSERYYLWWWGFCSLLLGYLAVQLRLYLDRELQPASIVSSLGRLSLSYFLILLSDLAVCNIVAGTARVFGFRVPDATYFVFLSRTPAEFWRRVNVYTYQFILKYVYIPLYRGVSRNVFFITLVAFTVFFINHHGFWYLLKAGGHSLGLNDALSVTELYYLRKFSFQFLFLFSLIYVSRRVWFFSQVPRIKDNLAWLSIAVTHVLMVFSFVLAEKCADLFIGVRFGR